MQSPYALKPALVAIISGAAALASALATAGTLRRTARSISHEQPRKEELFEVSTQTSPALISRGRTLFLASCAHCHGADARGDEGPDLHDVQVSDRYIANIITRGIPHEMPSFAKKHALADITALTAYVRSLK